MMVFAVDKHYGMRPGRALYDIVRDVYPIRLLEDDWSGFEAPDFAEQCGLLVLNMIAGTGHLEPPGPAAEAQVRCYVERGGSLLLLHGASAAFWHWDWWRPLVGYRWVRPDDPDGFQPSVHAVRPYRVVVSKSRHPLCRVLRDMDVPEDELYIGLEQTCAASTLMETGTHEGTFVQCYESHTPWGGTVVGFLPGHKPDVVRDPSLVANVRALLDYLLAERKARQ